MKTTVREIKLKNNQIGVQIDIHRNGKRTQRMLNVRYADIPRNAVERQDKKEKKELVKKIVAKMEIDSLYSDNMIDKDYQLDKGFFEYCDEFIKRKAPHSEIRAYIAVTKKLKDYIQSDTLICSEINEDFLLEFRDYLDAHLNGVTAYNYFKKLRRMIKEATYSKYFKENPMERITNTKGKSIEKQTLTNDEVKLLVNTDCSNDEVKNAFLFSCLTGLRFCDIIRLKWGNIRNGRIDIVQKKTQERVVIDLHENCYKLIGKTQKPHDLVFSLPSHTACLKHLKKWVEDAEIDKHITWHCSRHSFATDLILNDTHITAVSKLLGHKSLRETETYVRVAEMTKENAIKNLTPIF